MAAFKHEACPLSLESFTDANRSVLLDAEGYCLTCSRLGKPNVLPAFHPERAQQGSGGRGGGSDQVLQNISENMELLLRNDQNISENIELLSRTVHHLVEGVVSNRRDAFYLEVSDNSSNTSTGERLKDMLIGRYQNTAPDGVSLICMVSHETVSKSLCRAGHILPKKSVSALSSFGLDAYDIHSVRNGVLWAKGIEDVFNPAGKVCFLYDFVHNDLIFKVLDPDLLDKNVEGTNLKFGDINGRSLLVPRTPDGQKLFPFLRLIWQHSDAAISRAHKTNTISDGEFGKLEEYLKTTRELMQDIIEHKKTSQEAIQSCKEDFQPPR